MEKKVVSLEVNSNLEQTEKSVGSLKQQLRAAQNEVASLSDKFGATSKEAVNAAKRAGELADKIGDAKALTDAFNPDAKFKALSSSLGGVASGFAAYQGALGLVGIESKDLEEQLLKVQSAMALSQGLQSVGESVDSFKQLGAVIKNTSAAQKVLTAYTTAYTFVTGAATTGMKAFRLALISTGIGAIVVAVGLLIANFDKVKKVVLNLVPGLALVGDFVMGIVENITDFIGVTSEAERALAELTKQADKSLAMNKKYVAEQGDILNEYTKQKIEAKNKYLEAVKEEGANQKALADRLNRELLAIDKKHNEDLAKGRKEKQDKIDSENEKAREKAKADRLKEQEEEKAFRNDVLTNQQQMNVDKVNSEIQDMLDEKDRKQKSLEDISEMVDTIETENTAKAKAESEKRIEIAKYEAQQKTDIQNAQFALADSAVNFLKVIGGKNKAIQKAAIIAENAIGIGKMIIANNAANIGALATPQSILTSGASAIPVIAMNNITTGIGVATTIASTAKALAALGGGSAGGAPSLRGGSGGASSSTSTAPPNFNVVGTSGQNQIAQTLNREQPPVKAYVVANDVTTQQGLNRNIVKSASI